jgi:hypothetical protein
MLFPSLDRVIWLALFRAPAGAVSAPPLAVFNAARIGLTILVIAAAYAYYRGPILRRRLMATGSDRYTEPIRSTFAKTWLSEAGRFFKILSPAAGAPDSLSVWMMTIVAPVAGMALVSSAWHLNNSVWGLTAILLAALSLRHAMATSDASDEITHVHTVAAVLWGLLGLALTGDAVGHALSLDVDAIVLGTAAIYSVALLLILSGPRFVAAIGMARMVTAMTVVFVLYLELVAVGGDRRIAGQHITFLFSAAELTAIGAGLFAWRGMSGRSSLRVASVGLALGSYIAFLLVDARVLGSIWTPLVTASYAIIGTLMLIASRSGDNEVMRKVGGITLAIVVVRLMFVDLVGVDTIWRVLLFLGCGALFLFASHQLQSTNAGERAGQT